MAKRGFSLEGHRELSVELGSIRDALASLSVMITNAYPQKSCKNLDKTIRSLDLERSNLEDKICKEHPELEDGDLLNIYFGDRSGTKPKREAE